MTAGFQVRKKRMRPPRVKEWRVDGWFGMYDSRSKKAEQDGDAALLINLMPTDLQRGGPVQLRPGRQPAFGAATAPQVGLAGLRNVQWVGYAKLSAAVGGDTLYVIADGEIWAISGGGVATKRISAAQLTGAGITFSALLSVQAVGFDGTLVVVGGGRPFTWTGANGVGLVSLTNAPFAASHVTVYYSKLVMLDGSGTQHVTILWSEENQANTGYAAGGYNNAWELTQTSQEDVTGILGTNEGLYFWRAYSVGIIRGAVTASFQSDGVHDSVYQGSGVFGNYGSTTWCADSIFWTDMKGQVMAFRPGVGVTNLTDQLPRVFGSAVKQWGAPYGLGEQGPANTSTQAQQLIADPINARLHVEMSGATARWTMIFDARTYKFLSLWDFGAAHSANTDAISAVVVQESGFNSFYAYVDTNGFVFTQKVASSSIQPPTADYDNAGVGTPIVGILVGPMHGHSISRTEWQFTDMDVTIDQISSSTTAIGYLTSRQHKANLTPADQSVVVAGAANAPYERSIPVGINANGRWLRPVISITGATSGDPPQIFGYAVRGVLISETPMVT